MALMLLGLAGLVVAVAAWWWLHSRPAAPPARPRPPARRDGQDAGPSALPAGQARTATPPDDGSAPLPPLPPVALPLRAAELLDGPQAELLVQALRQLPRPPRAIHTLMSPQFVQAASSAELATLVMGEPAVAARVVAAANSPLYGLQQPVTSVGQAITFLGLASVRQQCLQHLLADCFKPRDAAQQREFDLLWRASSIAGELYQQLATRLRVPETASLVTLLVLSFLGRQACAALLDEADLDGMDAYQRALHEEQSLGLVSHELGHLLMRAWDVPRDLADDARTLSALRFDPERTVPPQREAALALGALCAMLGERIARGQVGKALFDPAHDTRPDMAALRPRLSRPPLDGLAQELDAPAMLRVVSRLMGPAR
ncbi:HDOD domain-containing protein [Roseateles sp.]|uniref:HDOD domain-containing protein n=1 Tax=Roseateles sp. TaxID=1971397 RepID=UPI0039EBB5D6